MSLPSSAVSESNESPTSANGASSSISGSVIRSGLAWIRGVSRPISKPCSLEVVGENIAPALVCAVSVAMLTSLAGFTIAITPRSLRETCRQNQLPDSAWPRGQLLQSENNILALYVYLFILFDLYCLLL